MRNLRPIFLAIVIVAAFYVITTAGHLPFSLPVAHKASVSHVEITEAAGPNPVDAEEQNNISVYKRVLPSVVNITSNSVSWDFFYGAVPQQGQGSGLIIDKDGHILTNYHVVEDARQLQVMLSNRHTYKAALIGADPAHDIAVVQINAPDLEPATLGDSKGLQVGQKVYAIGNPFGLNGTMTRGIISSLRSIRGPDGATPIDDAIQTDAAINPGNSGGPLLNSRGDVIGINSMILTGGANQSAGVGFAIPINVAKAVLNDLVTVGRVRRPSLGIRGLPISPDLAEQMGLPAENGVMIMQVVPGGAAERAGLRGGSERAYLGNAPILLGGDLIVAIDGQAINDTRDLAGVMNNHKAGDTIHVTVYRGKRKMEVVVTLGEVHDTA